MATPVLNNTLNTLLSVQPGSSASRAHDGERLADFSSLLRGQMQNGAKADTTRTFPARNEAVPNQASRHPQRAAEKPRADGAGNRCEPTPPAPTSASAPDTGNSGENPSASAAQDQDQASETPLPENASQPVQQTPGAPETPAAQASALSAAIAALLNKFADAANNEAALPTGEAVAETDALPLEKDSAREPTLAATAKLARAPILAAHATASP
ncbi:MAG: hypothetical protein LBB76_05680, partial [Azoarcus sp.]|nr:hypothetical protein [Azoarcus sp.]